MAIIAQESKWSEKNLNINLDLDEVTIFYDETLFAHVWQNLISNAIKFSNEGGDINIVLKNTIRKSYSSLKTTARVCRRKRVKEFSKNFSKEICRGRKRATAWDLRS